MAENVQNIHQQPRACPKNCRQCGMIQQMYCTARMTFDSYEVMNTIIERLDRIESKMNTMQTSETELISPTAHESVPDGTITHQD